MTLRDYDSPAPWWQRVCAAQIVHATGDPHADPPSPMTTPITSATSTDTMAHLLTSGIGLSKPGDWPEDFGYENGCYLRCCCLCHQTFTGHKWRVICKVCAERDAAESRKRAEWLHAHNAPRTG